MCMNRGRGEVNERHKPGDIVLDDLRRAAQNHGLEVEPAADNLHSAARKLKEEGSIRQIRVLRGNIRGAHGL